MLGCINRSLASRTREEVVLDKVGKQICCQRKRNHTRVALNHVFFQMAGAVKCATKERRRFREGTNCL